MPAKNPCVNVVLERPLYEALGRLARREGTSLSLKVRDLLREALEAHEDWSWDIWPRSASGPSIGLGASRTTSVAGLGALQEALIAVHPPLPSDGWLRTTFLMFRPTFTLESLAPLTDD